LEEKGDSESAAIPAGGDKGKEIDEECFDDNDFYQQLLREVVESRMLDLGRILFVVSDQQFWRLTLLC
jgi:hypothetical protein